MTEFDKVAYWKKRALAALQSNFTDTILMMKNVRETLLHINPDEPIELKRIINEYGASYEELAALIKDAKPKKPESKIIIAKKL